MQDLINANLGNRIQLLNNKNVLEQLPINAYASTRFNVLNRIYDYNTPCPLSTEELVEKLTCLKEEYLVGNPGACVKLSSLIDTMVTKKSRSALSLITPEGIIYNRGVPIWLQPTAISHTHLTKFVQEYKVYTYDIRDNIPTDKIIITDIFLN